MVPDTLTLHAMPFRWPVIAYLALAGVAAGAALGATAAAARGDRQRAARGYLLAAGAIAVGAAFLIADLERPASFAAILLYFNPSSAIAWGARALPLFALSSLVAGALLSLERRDAGKALGPFAVIAGLLGLFVGLYPGVVLYQALARPVWHSLFLLPLLFVSAVHMGLAALRWLSDDWEAVGEGWLLALQGVLLAAWLISLRPEAPAALDRMVRGSLAPYLWLGVVGIGLVVPWLATRGRALPRLALGLAPLAGGLALRALIVLGGQGGPGAVTQALFLHP